MLSSKFLAEQFEDFNGSPIRIWATDNDEKWDIGYQKLVRFVRKHGKIPTSGSSDLIEKEIGIWVNTQRANKRDKSRSSRPLRTDQIAKLESIPGWDWGFEDRWQINFEDVKSFIKKNKTFPNSRSTNKQERELGRWVLKQRETRKGEGNGRTLSVEKISQLESLPGWFWEKDVDKRWQERLTDLKTFQKNNRRLPNSRSHDTKEKSLGEWTGMQRRNKRGKGKRKLTSSQISQLESIPGWFWNK